MSVLIDGTGKPFEVTLQGEASYAVNVHSHPGSCEEAGEVATRNFYRKREEALRLYHEHSGLVRMVAMRMRWKDGKSDGIEGAGFDALLRAAEAFDESRDIRFTTFAERCIRNAFLDLARKTLRTEPQPPEEEEIVEHMQALDVQHMLSGLDEYDRVLLKARFWYELSFQEIASTLGIAKGTAHAHVAKALTRARIALEDRDRVLG